LGTAGGDNNSTDNTESVLAYYADRLPFERFSKQLLDYPMLETAQFERFKVISYYGPMTMFSLIMIG